MNKVPEDQGQWLRNVARNLNVPNRTLRRQEKKPLGVRCVTCGQMAKAGKKYCGPCLLREHPIEGREANKGTLNSETEDNKRTSQKLRDTRAANKSAKEKQRKKEKGWAMRGWAKSESSSISHRRVAKNKWRQTYKGPAVRDENYLMEEKDRFGFGEGPS